MLFNQNAEQLNVQICNQKKKKTVQFYEKPTSQDQLASLACILIKQTNTIYKPFHNSQL